jgi:D-alanyl-D-alanine carboxypeptidase
MHRFLATALVTVILAGCGSSGPAVSPDPVSTPGATTTAATDRPSVAPAVFPTGAFAALNDDPVPGDVAARYQAALAGASYRNGATATLITPDGTWSGASGTADGVLDMQPDSQFGIASVTKPIVAAQVMLLVEAGEISLDRPATDYLPADFDFDTNGATIRQLLSHRSGIPNWYDAMEEQMAVDRLRVRTTEEILALVRPDRGPTGAFDYADTNYNVLGLVLEHIHQRSLFEVLRDGVLRVPETDRLIWQPDEVPTDPMAMPRGESRDALELGGGYLPSLSDTVDGAAGAMVSDSISLARWWRAFCAGEIVSQASLTEMSTFYDNGGEYDYGLGLFNPVWRAGARAVGHLGANFGYKSSAGCLTEEHVVFVVLTNQVAIGSHDLAPPLVRAYLSE